MNEDLVFNLEQPLIIPSNNNYQNRGNFKFVVDGKSLDWYNSRLSIYFKLTRLNGIRILTNEQMIEMELLMVQVHLLKKLVLVLMEKKFIDVIMLIMLTLKIFLIMILFMQKLLHLMNFTILIKQVTQTEMSLLEG